MSFARAYLEKVSLDPTIDHKDPSPDLSLIVAIPCYNEPELLNTLHSLKQCTPTEGDVEVIIAINSSQSSDESAIKQNRLSEIEVDNFSREHTDQKFCILQTNKSGIQAREAGAGFARKLAMDHALSRFHKLGKKDGIILSLDADTLCDTDYLSAVEKHFSNNPKAKACSIYFEHPVEGPEFDPRVYTGIIQYELHLRYYIEGLRFAGHPHAYHTVGSAFAVRANTYASQGGMNKKSAGEDFYFLQKIIPLGNYSDLNSTCLIPSPRPSSRVAFGTGPVINQFLSGEIEELDSYDPRSFYDLREYISDIPRLFHSGRNSTLSIFNSWPESIQAELGDEFFERLKEIRSNSSSPASYQKRFFRWFNMFRTMKYINFAHREHYPKMPVRDAVNKFLNQTNAVEKPALEARDLLMLIRQKQRENSTIA